MKNESGHEVTFRDGGNFLAVPFYVKYDNYGEISYEPLKDDEITCMIAEAHDPGCAVMVHANGDGYCRAGIIAGTASFKYGFLMQGDLVSLWVRPSC